MAPAKNIRNPRLGKGDVHLGMELYASFVLTPVFNRGERSAVPLLTLVSTNYWFAGSAHACVRTPLQLKRRTRSFSMAGLTGLLK
jgi:hypothetical protein